MEDGGLESTVAGPYSLAAVDGNCCPCTIRHCHRRVCIFTCTHECFPCNLLAVVPGKPDRGQGDAPYDFDFQVPADVPEHQIVAPADGHHRIHVLCNGVSPVSLDFGDVEADGAFSRNRVRFAVGIHGTDFRSFFPGGFLISQKRECPLSAIEEFMVYVVRCEYAELVSAEPFHHPALLYGCADGTGLVAWDIPSFFGLFFGTSQDGYCQCG